MKRLFIILTFVSACVVATRAQVAQWLVPPAYENIEVPYGSNIAIADSANAFSIFTLGGHRVLGTTDQVFPYSDGRVVTTSIYDSYITGIYDGNGTSYPFEKVQLGWAYPCYHDGYLLVYDGHYFYYMNNNGEIPSPEYVRAYPFNHGYAPIFSYVNIRKQKDPYYALLDTNLEPIDLSIDGKTLNRGDIDFISAVNDEGLAIVVVDRKCYYFDASTAQLRPMYATPDETNLKNQVKLDGDFASSSTNMEDSVLVRAKAGRDKVVITFDYVMHPIATTCQDQRHEFATRPTRINNSSDHLAKIPANAAPGQMVGLSWDGKEVLPPQFQEIPIIFDDKAIVKLNGKYGLLQLHNNDHFSFKLNKGESIGFRHKRFNTTIRLDVPTYVSSNATTIDMDGVAGITVDKISRETKNTEYGNYVQYECVLDIPENISDNLTTMNFTARINYDGLKASPTPFTANCWHSQYYNVEIYDKETTISNGTLAFTSDIDPKRLAGESIYPYTVTLNTPGMRFELVEKVSETRYKWKVFGLREGLNTVNVRIQEEGCPPADVSFDVQYVKQSSGGRDKVVMTKKPVQQRQHLDI